MKIDIYPYARMASPKPRYCYDCDKLVQLVSTDENEFAPHCPCCGRHPGALELGLDSVPDHETRAELERMYGPR